MRCVSRQSFQKLDLPLRSANVATLLQVLRQGYVSPRTTTWEVSLDTNSPIQQPDVIVRGRHLDLGEFWVQHVREKTAGLARFGLGISRFDVEVLHEANPRQASKAWQVEIAAFTHGAPARAKGTGAEAEIAYERARETLELQLRRAAKRGRWSRHGTGATAKVARLLRG